MTGIPGPAWLASIFARVRSLFRGLRKRATVEAEISEEFRHHIELRTQDLIRGGLAPKEAARRANVEFGHVESHKERVRAARGLHFFDQIAFSWVDVKLGLRMLVKNPGLTIVAIFALGVGIPVGLAPWQFFHAFRAPLPVEDGDRVRAIRYYNVATTGPVIRGASLYELDEWREELKSFAVLGAQRPGLYSISSTNGAGRPVPGAEVTASTFVVLRVPPLMGRTLDEADEVVGAPDVVVIGYDLWLSRFGSDPDIVGRAMPVSGVSHTVVGVMPDGFRFPHWHQLWVPLRQAPASSPGEGAPMWIFGRLAENVTEAQANTEVGALGRRMSEAFPDARAGLLAEVVPFGLTLFSMPRQNFVTSPQFYYFQIAALFLLFVACANVAILVFARAATRFRELAVRTALGASRRRILSQMFAEALVLTLLATGLGLFASDRLYGRLFSALSASPGADRPYWLDLGVTQGVVLWGLSLAALSAVVAGVLPALKVTGNKVQHSLQQRSAGRSGIRFGRATSALIVLDVALAVAAVGFGTLMSNRLLERWRTAELVGIPAEEYLAVQLDLAPGLQAGGEERLYSAELEERLMLTQQMLVERLEAEPGVRAVAAADVLPRMEHPDVEIEVESEARQGGARRRMVHVARVDPSFFDGLDVPIVAGRGFDRADLGEDAAAVIVNTAFVNQILRGRNPIGQRIRLVSGPETDEPRWNEIVGVVGPLGMNILSADGGQGVYLPAAPGQLRPLRLAIHVGASPEEFTPKLREIVGEVDPLATIVEPRALSRFVPAGWYVDLAVQVALTALIVILLSLAVSGLYAITSFAVSERAREIGIRTALGAQRGVLGLMIARRALWQIGLGVMLGTPPVAWMFYGMREYSGLEFSSAWAVATAFLPGMGVMILVALLACTAPTLRVLRIEPSEVLKAEG